MRRLMTPALQGLRAMLDVATQNDEKNFDESSSKMLLLLFLTATSSVHSHWYLTLVVLLKVILALRWLAIC